MTAHQHHAQLRADPFIKPDRRPSEEQYFDDDLNIYDGEFITDILQGMKAFPDNRRLKFRPGTLAMDSVQTIQHCYVDMDLYGSHFDNLLSCRHLCLTNTNLFIQTSPSQHQAPPDM